MRVKCTHFVQSIYSWVLGFVCRLRLFMYFVACIYVYILMIDLFLFHLSLGLLNASNMYREKIFWIYIFGLMELVCEFFHLWHLIYVFLCKKSISRWISLSRRSCFVKSMNFKSYCNWWYVCIFTDFIYIYE